MGNTTSIKIVSFCKRAFLCLVASVVALAVWRLFLGDRLFRIGLHTVEKANIFAVIYFVALFCILYFLGDIIQRKSIVVVICWALVAGYVDWLVTYQVFCVYYHRNSPTVNCFVFQDFYDILFWPLIALAHLSYFITLTAVMLLRLAWKIDDKMAPGNAS